jgi:hypothetical protein
LLTDVGEPGADHASIDRPLGGLLASRSAIRASSSVGASARAERNDGGGRCRCWDATLSGLSSMNGGLVVSIGRAHT